MRNGYGICLFFLVATSASAQTQPPASIPNKGEANSSVANTASQFNPERFQEKVYLQTDKPYYATGETIWFSGYMNYRTPGMRDTLSKVLYVDLLNPLHLPVRSLVLPIDSGMITGSFSIPEDTGPGAYTIRAYTNWMRNYGVYEFFYKALPILNPWDKLSARAPELRDFGAPVKITLDQPGYHKREEVKMKITLLGEDRNLKASLSLSVTDETRVVPVEGARTIINNYYMANGLPQGMLPVFKYPIERGIRFEGTYYYKPGKVRKTKLTIVQGDLQNIYQETTDEKGYFSIPNLQFYDSLKFAVQPASGKVVLVYRDLPAPPSRMPRYTVVQKAIDSFNTVLLKPVDVKASRPESHYLNPYGRPDFYLKGETMELYSSIAEAIVAKLLGYQFTSSNGHWYLISVRGGGEPVLYIDNSQMFGETVGDQLFALNPSVIDHVEVNGMISSALGANGSNGAIYVYRKRGSRDDFKPLPVFKIRGFDKPATFQSPVYPGTQAATEDHRSTLYWNPKVNLTSSKNTVDLSFFTSDQTGKYRVIVEGVNQKGTPFRLETEIVVNE